MFCSKSAEQCLPMYEYQTVNAAGWPRCCLLSFCGGRTLFSQEVVWSAIVVCFRLRNLMCEAEKTRVLTEATTSTALVIMMASQAFVVG